MQPTLVTLVCVVFNLAPGLHNEILPVGVGGYSLVQALRDGMIAQIVQLGTELVLVARGRDRRRFIHVKDPVEVRVITFAGSRDEAGGKHRQGRI